MTDLSSYPALSRLLGRVASLWPEHQDYIDRSFADRNANVMAVSERVASCALRLADHMEGGLDGLCADYRFLCEQIVLPEEMHFRRNNRYRLSSFADAQRECYDNAPFMGRYMNGLLISNVIWNNHAHAITHYVSTYLPGLRAGFDLLELGPGHGLFVYFAASNPNAGSVSGWDISPTSIAHTRMALATLGVEKPVRLEQQNLFEAPDDDRRFDAIVMSEILEHLEDPVAALQAAKARLRPGGSIWVNVPANSPAPDHIFLVQSPEHACELVQAAGLEVAASEAFPMTGATLEKARKRQLAISCVVVARNPA